MLKPPPRDLLKTVEEIPGSYVRCRETGRHSFSKMYGVKRVERGRVFEVMMQCEFCDTFRKFYRSAIDGSMVRDRNPSYTYPEGYKMSGLDVTKVRDTLWLLKLQNAEDAAEPREEPAIPQRKRRNSPTTKRGKS